MKQGNKNLFEHRQFTAEIIYRTILGRDGLVDYTELSVPLGRRFRASKLWFVIRSYGSRPCRA